MPVIYIYIVSCQLNIQTTFVTFVNKPRPNPDECIINESITLYKTVSQARQCDELLTIAHRYIMNN